MTRGGWLGWVAAHTEPHGRIAWWDITSWVDATWRDRVMAWIVMPLWLTWTSLPFLTMRALGHGERVSALMTFLVVATIPTIALTSPGRVQQGPSARWKRWTQLIFALVCGLTLRRTVIRMRQFPPDEYPAARRAMFLDVATCLYTGVPTASLAVALGPVWLGAGLILSTIAAAAALGGRYSAVKQAELALLLQYRSRISVHRLLENSVTRGRLTVSGGHYRFRDERLRELLARRHTPTDAPSAPKPPARLALLSTLESERRPRIIGCAAVGATVGLFVSFVGHAYNGSAWILVPGVLLAVVGGAIALAAFDTVAIYLATLVRRSIDRTALVPQVVQLSLLAVVVWLAIRIGADRLWHTMISVTVYLMPAVAVAVVVGWLWHRSDRRHRAARRRWLRFIPELVLIGLTAGIVVALLGRDFAATQLGLGLLFPLAVWQSVAVWPALNRSPRIAVRASADIVVSLLLGITFTLLLVWLANLVRMTPQHLSAIRRFADTVGDAVDLPKLLWFTLYAMLAAVTVAKPPTWWARLRVVPGVNVTRRILTATQISVMAIALVAVAAVPATAPALHTRMATHYTTTVRQEFDDRGRLAAFRRIRERLDTDSTTTTAPLARVVARIHAISPAATPVARDLARRVGKLQAEVVQPTDSHAASDELSMAVETAAATDGFATTPGSAQEIASRADTLDQRSGRAADATAQANQAAELTAIAVSQVLQMPGISKSDVVVILKEYFGGLFENSHVRNVFASWAAKASRRPPPDPATTAIPSPTRLWAAAGMAMWTQLLLGRVNVDDLRRFEERLGTARSIETAVDMTNQVRFIQNPTGPCAGCAAPRPQEHGPAGEHPRPRGRR